MAHGASPFRLSSVTLPSQSRDLELTDASASKGTRHPQIRSLVHLGANLGSVGADDVALEFSRYSVNLLVEDARSLSVRQPIDLALLEQEYAN